MWSLVVEVQFYIVLPLLFISLKRVPPKICLWVITLVFLLIPFSARVITGHAVTIEPDINVHFHRRWIPSASAFSWRGWKILAS